MAIKGIANSLSLLLSKLKVEQSIATFGGGGGSGAVLEQPAQAALMRQLLGGNQFLTHVTAAPVPVPAEGGSDTFMPSGGFVHAGRRRASREQFKDRIVFFL